MKKSIKAKFSQLAKSRVLNSSCAFLTALAVVFAWAPCSGHLYEPEVPQKLQ